MTISVCIDVRSLPAGMVNGTGVYAMELLQHLPASIERTVLTRDARQRAELDRLGFREGGAAQVFHRPSQFFRRASLQAFLEAPLPVITYLDLISYRTPSHFESEALHRQYCALSLAAVHAAQAVLAISEHARREIVEELQLPGERVHAIPLGVDAEFFARSAPRRIEGDYFLCTGSDYPHKNLAPLLR